MSEILKAETLRLVVKQLGKVSHLGCFVVTHLYLNGAITKEQQQAFDAWIYTKIRPYATLKAHLTTKWFRQTNLAARKVWYLKQAHKLELLELQGEPSE